MFSSTVSLFIVVSNDVIILVLSMLHINCRIVPIVTDAVVLVLDIFDRSVFAVACLEFAVK